MTLKQGSRSLAVLTLQKKLNTVIGAKLYVDGDYGPGTARAVRTYQLRIGLVADGIAGTKTLAALNNEDTSKMLSQSDIERAAKDLGADVEAVMAVNLVESVGSGFLDHRPAILFERHVFVRRLLDHGVDQAGIDQLIATLPNIVNTRPGGYAGGTAEYQKLSTAQRIHHAAALESCSWGAFQIMGYHWQTMGYDSVAQFVGRVHISEGEHLDAFVRFIKADPALHKALKAKSWKQFARLYNGPAYAQNLYDVKMARAYSQFKELTSESVDA